MAFNPPADTQPVVTLGHLIQDYGLQRSWLYRWGSLCMAVTCLAGAIVVLAVSGYQAYQRYYLFGPAIVWKTVAFPLFVEGIVLVIGAIFAWIAFSSWNRCVRLYENGFSCHTRRGIEIWRWTEIDSYRYSVVKNYLAFLYAGESHRLVLTKNGNQLLVLSDDLEKIDQLAAFIREKTYPRLYMRLKTNFLAGKRVGFAPLAISQGSGLEYQQKIYPLKLLESWVNDNGFLCLSLNNGKGRSVIKLPTARIPNVDVLVAFLSEIQASQDKRSSAVNG